jgi:cation-transporting P-type ATPase F
MTVCALWTPERQYEVTGSGYRPEGSIVDLDGAAADLESDAALHWTLLAGARCNDALLAHIGEVWDVVGDPTEGAMVVVAAKAGFDSDRLAAEFPRLATIPFSSDRSYMASLHADPDRGHVVVAKGAAERLLDLCSTQMAPDGSLDALDRELVLDAAEALAGEGLRVLATAMTDVDPEEPFDEDSLEGMLAFTGLQAMLDPPRAAAIGAVAACHTAGIDTKMITGDHATTASAIALQLGILTEPRDGDVLTGTDLVELSAADYPGAVERASVLARVSPEQKLRLVEGLQARDHVVAMTGDGVNDAPALQQADIGVAMGRGGTEVAKDASDMILTDDDFATIEAAIEEGRGVFDNLTKFIVWTLPTNMGEGLVILLSILVGATLPILPAQILWINMTTAVALGLMLAFEPRELGIMQRPPRDPRRPLLTSALVVRILLVAALLVGGAWWVFEWEQSSGASLEEARTAAVNLFVAVEAFYLFSCRSLTRPVRQIGFFSNRWIVVGVTAQAVGQLGITYLPFMNRVFQTAAIGLDTWLRILAIAAAATVLVSIDKRVRRGLR